jgi:hypothetical protein
MTNTKMMRSTSTKKSRSDSTRIVRQISRLEKDIQLLLGSFSSGLLVDPSVVLIGVAAELLMDYPSG